MYLTCADLFENSFSSHKEKSVLELESDFDTE